MSNYPPGVTGNELAIAGFDYEGPSRVECEGECEFFGLADISWYRGIGWWECPDCGTEHTIDHTEDPRDYERNDSE